MRLFAVLRQRYGLTTADIADLDPRQVRQYLLDLADQGDVIDGDDLVKKTRTTISAFTRAYEKLGYPPEEAKKLAVGQWERATRPPPSRLVPEGEPAAGHPSRPPGFKPVNPFSVPLP